MRPTRSPRRAVPVKRTVIAVSVAAAALLTASACSSSGGGKAPDNAAPGFTFASGTATPGMVPDGSGPTGMPGMSMPSTSAAAAAPAGPNAVNIDNFAFGPSSLTVKTGTTVTWTNKDEEPHTVVANDGSFRSPTLGTGATYTFTFTKAGSFAYVCSIHPFMHATVVVTQ
ncbi:cupredoxin family copper-binding protein [Nocardia sp. NPDC059240]|uniref:cupredoxin domain-containing protein n=1 Tax=Nocardia sp. NPDC059240 TaxID=3346786 RepID=UPI0036B98660